ncbi:MAG: hypothetical protein IPP29_12615 [Bacteroidetes bacterium]|nr:hypothetical protein [Bacteroidota bacterium]
MDEKNLTDPTDDEFLPVPTQDCTVYFTASNDAITNNGGVLQSCTNWMALPEWCY